MILRYFFNLDERGVKCGILECRWNGRTVRGRLFFFSRCLYFIRLCDRVEISLLFSPALGIFHLSFFLSVFFLPVQSKVRRLPTQLLCQRPRTRRVFLVFAIGKVGEWDGAPSLYQVQNPMEDSEGSWWAVFPASRFTQAVRGGTSGLPPSVPTRGKGQSAGDCLLQHT